MPRLTEPKAAGTGSQTFLESILIPQVISQSPGGRAIINVHFHSGGGSTWFSLKRTLIPDTCSPSLLAMRLTKPRPQL